MSGAEGTGQRCQRTKHMMSMVIVHTECSSECCGMNKLINRNRYKNNPLEDIQINFFRTDSSEEVTHRKLTARF